MPEPNDPSGYAGDMSSPYVPEDLHIASEAVYDIQVASHLAAVEMLRPGVPFVKVYERASEVICAGMRDLGIPNGGPAEAVAAGATRCSSGVDSAT